MLPLQDALDGASDEGIIVNNEHPAAPGRGEIRGGRGMKGSLGGGLKEDLDEGAFAKLALDLDLASQGGQDPAAQRESEAGPDAGGLGCKEGGKELGEVLWGDADAGVL